MPALKYADLPIDDEAKTRSKSEAIRSALSDGVTLEDKRGRDRVKKIMSWWDGKGTTEDGYKMPVGAYVNGRAVAIWGNVTAAVAAINGSRGGVDLPAGEKRAVFNHLMRYYDKQGVDDDEQPEFRGSDADAVVTLAGMDIGSEPPREFRILKSGSNRARKGRTDMDIVFDAKARTAMAESIRPNRALPFDVGHRQLSGGFGSPADDEAVGWFQPEMRGNELWATDVEFTDDMADKIRARKFRFFSPAFDIELAQSRGKEIVRPVGLINMALTNIPALRDIAPLVASETDPEDEWDTTAEPDSDDAPTASFEVRLRDSDEFRELAELCASQQVRIVELEAAAAKRVERDYAAAVEDEIRALQAAGKLPDSLLGWARSRTLAQLSAWGSSAPAAPAPTSAPRGTEPYVAPSVESLPSEELRFMADQLGVSLADVVRHHAERAGKSRIH